MLKRLIAKIFPIVSVYCLRGGRYAYRGNVINFPQDVLEFATRLPQNPSSLDVLIVRRQSANGSSAFRDFNVRRTKVDRKLHWLKENNGTMLILQSTKKCCDLYLTTAR